MMPAPESSCGSRKRELFLAALEMPAASRADFLEQACAGDCSLRADIEALLVDHVEDSFLEQPPESAAPCIALPSAEQPGDVIGRYKLLEKIGEGGCGVVFMAEQEEPVRRRVALK